MEDVNDPKSNKSKRRVAKKLQVNEGVEVRSVEEGFLGSWHPGTVIKCGKLKRHVRYKNVLKDDGLDYLVDVVRVSKALDGDSGPSNCNKRGFIRPLPPLVEFERWDLKFGLCVDVSYQEAWWEGVIFDHCDGMEKRSVFFPDLGDEMQVGIHQLRITQDWDEVTEEWKRRGNWVFLELVEKCQRESFVAVSARQIWYDVQVKKEFGLIGEWTYNVKDPCRNMVMEVVNDYLTLTIKELFSVLNLPGSLLNERPEQESVEPMANDDLNMTLPDKEIVVQKETSPAVKEILPEFQKEITPEGAREVVSGARCSKKSRSTANRKPKSLRDSKANVPKCNGLPLRVLRSNKRVQKESAPLPLHRKPLNVLSWLIDNHLVSPKSKVYYKAKGRQYTGRITHNGIKCDCCRTIYSFVGFENHASGSSTCRPSASIFLEDGRTLLDCQIQIMQDHKTRESNEKPFSDLTLNENDYICSVCYYGGELILCDQCPSSFHQMCLDLENIPDGDWFCPSCCCGICGQSKIDDEDGHVLTCVQCEHKYHVRCLKNGAVDISIYPENWFCGKNCEKIHEGLHQLLGKPVSVGVAHLTWTLLKFIKPDSCDLGRIKSDSLLAESHSKLNLALSLMHECFEPLKESFSSRDLVKDVIFSRRSELNRLNFQGFYTVLLERNEELISAATVRVHGKKVAEVPLVGTRLQYRRNGMCHVLMNELEKKLMQLGVERLVLPAVPSVLETWTGSFGFAKMTNFERSQFLDYTFLDFQDTTMCQKLLMKIPSPDSGLLIADFQESQQRCDVFSGSCVNFNKPSPVSEVSKVEEIDKGGMLMGDTCAGNNDHHVIGALDPVTMVEQPSPRDQQCQNGTSSQCFLEKQAYRYNGPYKYHYTRRKVKKSCEGFGMPL
ncbi:Increased DNA methylation 1 [Spatholobus suberectus]|nr:Increased DNA methylation 1 [Spatholobus suberectus]